MNDYRRVKIRWSIKDIGEDANQIRSATEGGQTADLPVEFPTTSELWIKLGAPDRGEHHQAAAALQKLSS